MLLSAWQQFTIFRVILFRRRERRGGDCFCCATFPRCLPACLLSRPLFGVVGGCGWRPAEGRPGKGEGSREGHGTCKSARAWLQAFPLSDSVQNRSPKRCPSLRMKHFPPGCNYVTCIHTDIHTYMMIFEYLRGSWSKANPCAVA